MRVFLDRGRRPENLGQSSFSQEATVDSTSKNVASRLAAALVPDAQFESSIVKISQFKRMPCKRSDHHTLLKGPLKITRERGGKKKKKAAAPWPSECRLRLSRRHPDNGKEQTRRLRVTSAAPSHPSTSAAAEQVLLAAFGPRKFMSDISLMSPTSSIYAHIRPALPMTRVRIVHNASFGPRIAFHDTGSSRFFLSVYFGKNLCSCWDLTLSCFRPGSHQTLNRREVKGRFNSAPV